VANVLRDDLGTKIPSGPDSKSSPHSDGLKAGFMPIVTRSPKAPRPLRASYNKLKPSPRAAIGHRAAASGCRGTGATGTRATTSADAAPPSPPTTTRPGVSPGPSSEAKHPTQMGFSHSLSAHEPRPWARAPPLSRSCPPPQLRLWDHKMAAAVEASSPPGSERVLSQHSLATTSLVGSEPCDQHRPITENLRMIGSFQVTGSTSGQESEVTPKRDPDCGVSCSEDVWVLVPRRRMSKCCPGHSLRSLT
jgi:hypothetical protein